MDSQVKESSKSDLFKHPSPSVCESHRLVEIVPIEECVVSETLVNKRFEGCPGSSIEENVVRKIFNYKGVGKRNTRIKFFVEFKYIDVVNESGYYRNWVPYTVLRKLEPKKKLIEFFRSLYIYYPSKAEPLMKAFRMRNINYYEYLTKSDIELRLHLIIKECNQKLDDVMEGWKEVKREEYLIFR